MDTVFDNEGYITSGSDDVIIHHNQDYCISYYRFECGKSFVEICRDMGLDSANDTTISI